MLKWSGLEWDEGPGSLYEDKHIDSDMPAHLTLGPKGPYFQSKRLSIYHKFINTLLENGDAYPCFCTTERLQ